MQRRFALNLVMAGVALAAFGTAAPAMAHPHVWVTSKAEVVFEGGKLVGIDHHWTFDEFYTAMAIQGLDINNDGVYSREELAELAKVNMEGLAEFEFFTFAKREQAKLLFAAPTGAWLDHKDGILALRFRLPLKEPAVAEQPGFSFAVHDPSSFIAFELAKGDAVTLGAGAPEGCKIALAEAETAANAANNQSLTGAFTEQFGASAMVPGNVKSASIACVKS
jgi:ABC-type uncharacterized transport system substrate-binding protein